MLGIVIGDMVGSVYEFRSLRRKDFMPLFHDEARFTDDTVCTIGVADALVSGDDPKRRLIQWCRKYSENGGWGRRFSFWFMSEDPRPYQSWGNGAAMRVAPVGLLATSEEEVSAWSDTVSSLTHDTDEAMLSARAVALAVFWARGRESPARIRAKVSELTGYDLSRNVDDIRKTYQRSERASESVPEALICALGSLSFEDAIRTAISIGGDSDTIAAIAGGVAEALHGIPSEIAREGWGRLPLDMRHVLKQFYDQVNGNVASGV